MDRLKEKWQMVAVCIRRQSQLR